MNSITTKASSPVSRTSAFVSSFLRLLLVPIIAIGTPCWPILFIISFVPIVGIIAIPLLLSLSLLLFYSIPWFSYLLLAQSSPPSSQHSNIYLPFLPYSPSRCAKINWIAFQYAWIALTVGIPLAADWCYRKVMIIGTHNGRTMVKEGILYGSPFPSKRLDIYSPSTDRVSPNPSVSPFATMKSRTRKHSTLFAEDFNPSIDSSSASRNDGRHGIADERLAPVVVFLPSAIPPITWTTKRTTYLQLALRLRGMGFCVVVPDVTYFPEARISDSITDLRLVLRWTALNCARYGGDPHKIYLMSHGLGSHLAMLTITQEAVVLSREGWLESERMRERESSGVGHSQQQREREEMIRWDREIGDQDEDEEELKLGGAPAPSAQSSSRRRHRGARQSSRRPQHPHGPDRSQEAGSGTDEWVDETESYDEDDDEEEEEILPPGHVMSSRATRGAEARVRKQMEALEQEEDSESGDGSSSFRAATSRFNRSGREPGSTFQPSTSTSSNFQAPQARQSASSYDSNPPASASISNGLSRVELVSPEIEIPPLAGMILIAGVSDVIKGYKHETKRGIETLSSLRRAVGPNHTKCLLHSPAHLVYAAKNILDVGLFPPKFLFIHGGADSVVPIEQSSLMKTLLTGVGIEHVKLRAYRELSHAESVTSLFMGMRKTKYSRQIMNDVKDFVSNN